MKFPARAVASGLMTGLILAACSVGPAPEVEKNMASMAPADGWKAGGVGGEVKNGWIANFGDPLLIKLVSEGMDKNPDLLIASARLDQSIAEAKKAGAALVPTADLNSSGSRQQPFRSGSGENFPEGTAALGASLQLNWELDIWGRMRDAKRGAGAQLLASQADYDFARRSLAAQIGKAYFFSVQTKLQRDLTQQFVSNYQDTLRIVQARFDGGTVTRQDVANAKADLATAQQSAQASETAFNEANRSLETLLGRYPANEMKVAKDLQAVPPSIPSGLPSWILERRPDVIAAERRVAAAYQFTKEAQAARLPRLALTASVGGSSNVLQEIVNPRNVLANFGANLFAPLFDGGLRKADFEKAQGAQKEAVANYTKVALKAFQDVENALDREESLNKQESSLAEAAKNYTEARKIAEVRYKEGATDLTNVLVVQRQEIQAISNLIRTKGERLAQRVNLHLALGGNFEESPPATTPVKVN